MYFLSFSGVIVFQIVLALFIIVLVFKMALWWFSQRVALLAAFLASINLGLLVFPQFILAETLLCFFLLAALERLSAYVHQHRAHQLAISVLLFGLSVILKAAALYYVFFLAIVFLLYNQTIKWCGLHHIVLFLLMFLVPVGTSMVRNKMQYGYWYLTAVDKINLYTLFLPKLLSETKMVPREQAEKMVGDKLSVHEYASGRGWEKARVMLLNEVLAHPFVAVKIIIKNCCKTLLGLYSTHLKRLFSGEVWLPRSFFSFEGSWWQRIRDYCWYGTNSYGLASLCFLELFWNIIRLFFVFLAFISLCLKRQWLALLIFSSFLFYFILITFPDGCGRLRFMCEMQFTIMAALGIVESFKIKNLVLKCPSQDIH